MATKKKIEDSLLDAVGKDMDKQQTYNPLLVALRDNDKKHLFKTNVMRQSLTCMQTSRDAIYHQ